MLRKKFFGPFGSHAHESAVFEWDTICCYRGLESAQLAGARVDSDVMRRVHVCMYNRGDAANMPLYTLPFVGEKMRAAAPRVYRAQQLIQRAVTGGKLNAVKEPTVDDFIRCGADEDDARDTYRACQHLGAQLCILNLSTTEQPTFHLRRNDLLLSGAQYFHALLIGEALATTHDDVWAPYQRQLEVALVSSINQDGSWPLSDVTKGERSAICFPALATATAVQCLTLRTRQSELRRAARSWGEAPKAAAAPEDPQQRP